MAIKPIDVPEVKTFSKTRIFVGLILIIAAFICVVVIFYFIGQANKQRDEVIAGLQVQLVNLISEKADSSLTASEAQEVKRDPVTVQDLVDKTSILYDEKERSRREGILWIDRRTAKCIITLGAVNGLSVGSKLTVMKETEKVDVVTVDTPFDVISYVTPQSKRVAQFDNDYYRVVVGEVP